MDEMQAKKRGWVKNAVIVFLAVMLVLTFFSNTFMNRSLPEVATKYVISGEINSKIRGSGAVTANESYEVSLNQSRTVESVKVQVGDEVQEGDVLFLLSEGDSEQLKQAEDALYSANLAYQRALINATDLDYAKENRDIQLARTALEESQKELESYSGGTMTVQDAKTQMGVAEVVMQAAQSDVDKYQKQLGSLNPTSPDTSGLYSNYQAAESALSEARKALSSKILTVGSDYQELLTRVVEDRVEQAAIDVNGTGPDLSELKKLYAALEYEKFAGDSASVSAAQTELNEYLNSLEEDKETAQKVSDRFIKNWEPQLSVYMDAAANGGYTAAGNKGDPIMADNEEKAAYNDLKELVGKVSTAQQARDSAYSAYREAVGGDESDEYDRVNRLLQKAQETLDKATNSYNSAKKIYEGMLEADTNVKNNQRALEDLLFALEEQQKADNKTVQLEELNLQELQRNISRASQTVNELRKEATEPEVKANVSGVIESINVTAGKTAEAGVTICTITVPDMGYNVSFSVTTEQAKKVRVGDSATIANYWNNDINVTLAGIKTDPKDPQNSKILSFDVKGDVEPGTTLNLSIGQRSAQYDTIVPNSAIRSDSNGDFVLVVTSKSSPLGNRYVATRVDVEKVASDDTNTAVTGGLNAYDYVITTSSKPIADKDMVRLAE